MIIGKVINWGFSEVLARYVGRENDISQEITPMVSLLDKDIYNIWINKKAYTIKIWLNEGEQLEDNDILNIRENGNIEKVFSGCEREADIFVTNQCNSNCIMCPVAAAVRKKENREKTEWILNYIEALPDNIEYINITGGEPTLAGEDLFKILESLKNKFQYAGYQLLTNGRIFSDINYTENILNYIPYGLRFAIPVHSANVEIHDKITQAPKSFIQTDHGIRNLLKYRQKIEIRVVVSKRNVNTALDTAKYIVKNYKGVFCVNFIGMEMMGNAAVNRKDLWIDYKDAFIKIKRAIDYLILNGIDVQLYNFPLCAVEPGYRPIAVKSITDYKIRFKKECTQCAVRKICGGFFWSTRNLIDPDVYPIGEQ